MRLLTDEQRATINAEFESNLATIDKDIALAILDLRSFPNKSESGRKNILESTIRLLYKHARSEK